MKGEARLWLIRHAPVAGGSNIVHDFDAPADVTNLSVIAALRASLPAGATVFASPARRTLETAAALGLSPTHDPALREQDFGSWTGRSHDELAVEAGVAYRDFWRAPAANPAPGGESFADQVGRTCDRMASLPEGDVILVVHSGTVRAALAVALDLASESALRFAIDPLSLTRIDRLADGWRVLCVNHS